MAFLLGTIPSESPGINVTFLQFVTDGEAKKPVLVPCPLR